MARISMIHAAAAVRHPPHSPLDNENTKFDSVRLLKGAPPGRERVNKYASELANIKRRQNEYHKNLDHHVFMVNTGSGDEFDYHYKLYGGKGDPEYKFYVPQLIADITMKI